MKNLFLLMLLTYRLEAIAQTPPYPLSKYKITWQSSTLKQSGVGGDLWPTTWGSDDRLYTAWGDGAVVCGSKVQWGIAALSGTTPNANLTKVYCKPVNSGKGKVSGIVAAQGKLYAVVNNQDRAWPNPSFSLYQSLDLGRTWKKTSVSWTGNTGDIRPTGFVQFGKNATSTDGYIYFIANKAEGLSSADSIYMFRVPAGSILNKSLYQSYVGDGTTSVWKAGAVPTPIFVDSAKGVAGGDITYNPGLKTYLLAAPHGQGDQIGVFSGPNPFGPWTTVDYRDGWLGIRGGEYLGMRFPIKWMSQSGLSIWTIFSCYGSTTCGKFHDRFNLMRANLSLR